MQREVITTFSNKGWEMYGRRMVNSFVEHWPKDVQLTLYCEGLSEYKKELSTVKGNIVIKDLFKECPDLVTFIKAYPKPEHRGIFGEQHDFKKNAVGFSYKVFAQCHAIHNSTADILYFIDGDTRTFATPCMESLDEMMPNDCLCNYLGRGDVNTNKKTPFPETGFVTYNMSHPNIKDFANTFKDIYTSGEVFNLLYQVDCWTFDVARKRIEEKFNVKSYNIGGGKLGKKHPFINSPLGEFMDHMKGDRKDSQRSKWTDFKGGIAPSRRKLSYWDKIAKDFERDRGIE